MLLAARGWRYPWKALTNLQIVWLPGELSFDRRAEHEVNTHPMSWSKHGRMGPQALSILLHLHP